MSDPMNGNVMLRAVDLLYFWLEGYYSVDFEKDNELTDKLQEFIINEVATKTPSVCPAFDKFQLHLEVGDDNS